jgi:protein involved in polysaccharide export with SLBB domain
MRAWKWSGLVLSALVCFASVISERANAAETFYPIGVGDLLQITIYAGGEVQENFTAEVASDGKIATPLLGAVSVEGKLPTDAAEFLSHRLADGYYVNPRVIVGVKESAAKVFVLGEVARPGAYSVRDGLTALNACILAGGFSEYAALNRVKVVRQGKDRTDVYKIDLGKVRKGQKPDLVLKPGDRIEVPHRRF